jgi:hypothetical protein
MLALLVSVVSIFARYGVIDFTRVEQIVFVIAIARPAMSRGQHLQRQAYVKCYLHWTRAALLHACSVFKKQQCPTAILNRVSRVTLTQRTEKNARA